MKIISLVLIVTFSLNQVSYAGDGMRLAAKPGFSHLRPAALGNSEIRYSATDFSSGEQLELFPDVPEEPAVIAPERVTEYQPQDYAHIKFRHGRWVADGRWGTKGIREEIEAMVRGAMVDFSIDPADISSVRVNYIGSEDTDLAMRLKDDDARERLFIRKRVTIQKGRRGQRRNIRVTVYTYTEELAAQATLLDTANFMISRLKKLGYENDAAKFKQEVIEQPREKERKRATEEKRKVDKSRIRRERKKLFNRRGGLKETFHYTMQTIEGRRRIQREKVARYSLNVTLKRRPGKDKPKPEYAEVAFYKDGAVEVIGRRSILQRPAAEIAPIGFAPEHKEYEKFFHPDEPIIKYYFEEIRALNLQLIGLMVKRKTLQAKIAARRKARGRVSELKRELESTHRELSGIASALHGITDTIPRRGYPRYLSGYEDLRQQAVSQLRNAEWKISQANEPAACACMVAAMNRLAAEKIILLDRRMRASKDRKRFWFDEEDEKYKLIRGQHLKYVISRDTKTTFPVPVVSSFDLIWEAFRSVDNQIDGQLDEQKLLKGYIEKLDEITAHLRGANQKQLWSWREDISEMLEKLSRAIVGEKEMAAAGLEVVDKQLELMLEYPDPESTKSAGDVIAVIKRLLEARITTLSRMIENTKKGRLEELRKDITWRNEEIVGRSNNIIADLERKPWPNFKDALGRVCDFLHSRNDDSFKRISRYLREPEFKAVKTLLGGLIGSIKERDKDAALKKARIILKKGREAVYLGEFISVYRNLYVSLNIGGKEGMTQREAFDKVFAKMVKERQLIRGSPRVKSARLWWTRCYQAAFVPLKIDNPQDKDERVPNPTFLAISKFILIQEIDDLNECLKYLEQDNKTHTLMSQLSIKRQTFKDVSEEERAAIIDALYEDYKEKTGSVDKKQLFEACLVGEDTQANWPFVEPKAPSGNGYIINKLLPVLAVISATLITVISRIEGAIAQTAAAEGDLSTAGMNSTSSFSLEPAVWAFMYLAAAFTIGGIATLAVMFLRRMSSRRKTKTQEAAVSPVAIDRKFEPTAESLPIDLSNVATIYFGDRHGRYTEFREWLALLGIIRKGSVLFEDEWIAPEHVKIELIGDSIGRGEKGPAEIRIDSQVELYEYLVYLSEQSRSRGERSRVRKDVGNHEVRCLDRGLLPERLAELDNIKMQAYILDDVITHKRVVEETNELTAIMRLEQAIEGEPDYKLGGKGRIIRDICQRNLRCAGVSLMGRLILHAGLLPQVENEMGLCGLSVWDKAVRINQILRDEAARIKQDPASPINTDIPLFRKSQYRTREAVHEGIVPSNRDYIPGGGLWADWKEFIRIAEKMPEAITPHIVAHNPNEQPTDYINGFPIAQCADYRILGIRKNQVYMTTTDGGIDAVWFDQVETKKGVEWVILAREQVVSPEKEKEIIILSVIYSAPAEDINFQYIRDRVLPRISDAEIEKTLHSLIKRKKIKVHKGAQADIAKKLAQELKHRKKGDNLPKASLPDTKSQPEFITSEVVVAIAAAA